MQLTEQQLEQFDTDGYVLVPAVFSQSEIQRMKEAAMEYIEQENVAEMFVNERCDRGAEYDTIPAQVFYRELSAYCEKNALGDPPSKSVVGKQVRAMNYGLGKGNTGRFYTGIKWKAGCEPTTGSQGQFDHMYSSN